MLTGPADTQAEDTPVPRTVMFQDTTAKVPNAEVAHHVGSRGRATIETEIGIGTDVTLASSASTTRTGGTLVTTETHAMTAATTTT